MSPHFADKLLLQTVVNHPVHITNPKRGLSPSSFIPFCSFGENLIGDQINGFDLPACNIFKPNHFMNKLCFETDLQNLKDSNEKNLLLQLEMGLMLILDYNEERQMFIESIPSKEFGLKNEGNYDDGNFVSMHLDTLRN